MRTKIDKNNSKTLLQQKQRARWTELQKLDALFDEAVLVGFPSRPDYLTPHNALVSANTKAVEVSDELEVTTDHMKIVCSQGRLKVPQVSVSAAAEQHELTFTHKPERYGKRHMPTDQLFAMVAEKTLREAELFPLDTRADLEPVVVTLPADWTMVNLVTYVFALSDDGHKASDTGYVEIE